jgi:hypothetical protein
MSPYLHTEYGNEAFDSFLQFLGSKVRLKGWQDYRGGLDNIGSLLLFFVSSLFSHVAAVVFNHTAINTLLGDTTGTHSVYTKWRDYEIMFHVSTLLPFSFDNPQQLERKRHLGNDIVVLIFKEGNTPYIPDTIASDFNHVVAVVQPVRLCCSVALNSPFEQKCLPLTYIYAHTGTKEGQDDVSTIRVIEGWRTSVRPRSA